MKLSVVGPTYPFRGGISHYTSLLTRTLRKCHEVQFISYSRQYPAWLYPGSSDRDPSSSLIAGESPDQVFDALNPWAWRGVARTISKHQPRLVILPWSIVYWAPYYLIFLKALRRTSRAPVLFICHNVVEHESSWLKSAISRRALRRGDLFITHSHQDKANLVQWIGPSRESQVWVSPHPIYQHLRTQSLGKAAARARLGLNAERVLLFFGFVREYKGLRYLLESLPLILGEFSIHLIIAGEVWGELKTYTDLIRKLDLQNNVTFHHHYIPNEEVEAYFAAADIVTVPYVNATQSGIVQLAFGFRKPVIVGKVGGLPEVVEDLKTGYLVLPREPVAIANAVSDFYRANRESEMTQNIELQLPRFSWEKMLDTINEICTFQSRGGEAEG
jgi:glycosyltransferase involved in cell wall biosynthesis